MALLMALGGTGVAQTTDEPPAELDKAIDAADRMLNRFSELMKGLKEDAEDLAKKVPRILE